MKSFQLLIVIIALSFYSNVTSAQTDSLIITCDDVFVFTEDGSNYLPNVDSTWVICPELGGEEGNTISLLFSIDDFVLGAGDTLYVYDGVDDSANQLWTLFGGILDTDFFILPSPQNETGCLTFNFVSDADSNTVGTGWSADISCNFVCQPIEPLVTVDPEIGDSGYVDICQGTTVNFFASANYPLQGGSYYPQSDELSDFKWLFQDGTLIEEQNASYTYDEEGGYSVELTISNIIMDGADTVLYCESVEVIKMRVSTTPSFAGTLIENDPLCITATTFGIGEATPVVGGFPIGGIVSGETFLPDGDGVSYSTSIELNEFSPGQELESTSDLLGICLNMEHSYLGDLTIAITCPDMTTVVMKSFPGGGGTFLGEPIDDDANLDPGVGYDYCWTPNPDYSDMVTESATYTTLPEGSYTSENSLDALIGCPLNGTWTITVTDDLPSDNGYIFYWGLSINPLLSADYEYFVPEFVDMGWEDNSTIIEEFGVDSILILGTELTPVEYTYFVDDNWGCHYDTTISIDVLPPPVLFQGDSACVSIELQVGADGSWEGGVWEVVYTQNDTANVSISDTLDVSPIITSDTPGLVKLIFDDEYCRTQDTLNLFFYPLPTVVMSGDDVICWGDTSYYVANTTGPVDTYLWDTDEYDPDPINQTSFIVGDETNVYSVNVSGFCGETFDDMMVYSRACHVETPNIITPNGDFLNEAFIIKYIEYFPGSRFVVYNRWGKQVYETDDYNNLEPWYADGLKDGVYFYTLLLNDQWKRKEGQDRVVKGNVTVTRVRNR